MNIIEKMTTIFNQTKTGSTSDVTSAKRYNPNFHIFLQWSRDKCGMDFLNGIEDGSIRFDAMDQYDGILTLFRPIKNPNFSLQHTRYETIFQ